jgi:hypothetical protein
MLGQYRRESFRLAMASDRVLPTAKHDVTHIFAVAQFRARASSQHRRQHK